jgi:hypothetical protein
MDRDTVLSALNTRFYFFFFEIAILSSVAFGIPIANGGVHGVISWMWKHPNSHNCHQVHVDLGEKDLLLLLFTCVVDIG